MLLAHEWMRPGAIGVWLMPAEFLDVNYGVALKQYLTQHVCLLRMHCFDVEDTQFDDALVSSIVLIVRYAPPTGTMATQLTCGGSLVHPRASQDVPQQLLAGRRLEKWGRHFRSVSGGQLVQLANTITASVTIGDLFQVHRGLQTGCNTFFILTEAEALRRQLPTSMLTPLMPQPRHWRPTVHEANTTGMPPSHKRRVLFASPLSRAELATGHKTALAYIEEGEYQGWHVNRDCAKRAPIWYRLPVQEPAHFLVNIMGRATCNETEPFSLFRKSCGPHCDECLRTTDSQAAPRRKTGPVECNRANCVVESCSRLAAIRWRNSND
jgi:hypothetical protein